MLNNLVGSRMKEGITKNTLEQAVFYPAKVHPIAWFVVPLVLLVCGVGWWIGRTQEQGEDAASDVHAPRLGDDWAVKRNGEVQRERTTNLGCGSQHDNCKDRDYFFSAKHAAHLQ